ncbi:MAG: hypothetical protein IPK83_01630 [Planctomycetes bacterium]|nr:hypothetical protein [Planctomycetota bacterium]
MQNRSMSVGLNSTSTPGLRTGAVVIDNTDLTSAGAGAGASDGDDVLTIAAFVLEHAQPSFDQNANTTTLLIDFGTIEQNTGLVSLPFEIYNRDMVAGFTADLRITGISPAGDAATLTTDLLVNSIIQPDAPLSRFASLDTADTGEFSATFLIATADETLPGATARPSLLLALTAIVVPVPDCVPFDANCDTMVTLDDVAPFVELLLDSATPCDICTGDANGDSMIDALDINLFVSHLIAP